MYLREFIPKFMELPGTALPLLLMDVFGYDPDRPSKNCPDGLCQPAGVIWTIKVSLSVGPGLFGFLYMLVFLKFPLKDVCQHERINENCALHSSGSAAVCPLYGHVVDPPVEIVDAPDREVLGGRDRELLAGFQAGMKKFLDISPCGASGAGVEAEVARGGGAGTTGKAGAFDLKAKGLRKFLDNSLPPDVFERIARTAVTRTRGDEERNSDDLSTQLISSDEGVGASCATFRELQKKNLPQARAPSAIHKLGEKIYESRLFYFWPAELRAAVGLGVRNAKNENFEDAQREIHEKIMEIHLPGSKGPVALARPEEGAYSQKDSLQLANLRRGPVKELIVATVFAIVGLAVILSGLRQMLDGEQSFSVLGLVVLGVAIVLFYFGYRRLQCVRSLQKEIATHGVADRADMYLQCLLVLHFYEGFVGGDRREQGLWALTREYFSPMAMKE